MTENDKNNDQPQDESPDTTEDRPVFNPELIIENAADSDIVTPEDNLDDYLEKSDED